jgi:hypothetical protein
MAHCSAVRVAEVELSRRRGRKAGYEHRWCCRKDS